MLQKDSDDVEMEDAVPFTSKNPVYLPPEQRHALMQIPADLSDRELVLKRLISSPFLNSSFTKPVHEPFHMSIYNLTVRSRQAYPCKITSLGFEGDRQ